MSDSLELAQQRLLAPTGLTLGELDRTFGRLLGPGVDFGDLYFQHSRRESWTVEDGIVKEGAHRQSAHRRTGGGNPRHRHYRPARGSL
jgi:TldD protein